MASKRPNLAQLEERIQRQKRIIRQDKDQVERLRERIRTSQQNLRDMEKDLRAMKYEQMAKKMKESNIEVTDDLLDAFVCFAENRQNEAGSAAPEARGDALPPAVVPAGESPEDGDVPSRRAPSDMRTDHLPWENA